MIKAYVNYPNPHVTAHFDPDCNSIQAQNKQNQRYVRIQIDTISKVLDNFNNTKYKFAAYPDRNDMWLTIDFGDQEFELATLEYICHLLGKHYKPFAGLMPSIHCRPQGEVS
jgi:hypothetical protein